MKVKSVSGRREYTEICLEAARDDKVFNKFKTIPEYVRVLEHVDRLHGDLYFNMIKRDNPQLLEYFDKFKENDKYGTANILKFDEFDISPSTLRYVKVLSDLITIFGDLNNFKIAEIGGGYGGQCKIINDYFNIKDYHLIDLYEVNELSKKYLDKLNVENIRISTYDKLKIEKYDLIISNFAYSELHTDLQNHYKKMIVNGSKNGYMICNFIIGRSFPTYTKNKLLSLKNNIKSYYEKPKSKNIIIYWK